EPALGRVRLRQREEERDVVDVELRRALYVLLVGRRRRIGGRGARESGQKEGGDERGAREQHEHAPQHTLYHLVFAVTLCGYLPRRRRPRATVERRVGPRLRGVPRRGPNGPGSRGGAPLLVAPAARGASAPRGRRREGRRTRRRCCRSR